MADSTLKTSNPGKIPWRGGPSIKQNFSLPDTLIHYITMNPSSPKGYNKLIQTCKFFFEKNPILVTTFVGCTVISSTDDEGGPEDIRNCYVNISKVTSKVWLTGRFYLSDMDSNFTTLLCPKIFRCDLALLHLFGRNITFDDFKLLASSAKSIDLSQIKMTHKNGSDVMLDEILGALLNVERFNYYYFENVVQNVDCSIGRKITKLKNLGQLQKLILDNTPEIFDIQDLSKLFNDHKDKKFHFRFSSTISDEYRSQLDGLINTLIESGVSNRLIVYDGQDEQKYFIVYERFIWS